MSTDNKKIDKKDKNIIDKLNDRLEKSHKDYQTLQDKYTKLETEHNKLNQQYLLLVKDILKDVRNVRNNKNVII
jgi:hypothetical protein